MICEAKSTLDLVRQLVEGKVRRDPTHVKRAATVRVAPRLRLAPAPVSQIVCTPKVRRAVARPKSFALSGHPDLVGLTGSEYHRGYMHLWRAVKKAMAAGTITLSAAAIAAIRISTETKTVPTKSTK